MKISCPNCRKNFFVKDELIPSEGRKLQCGKCFNQWFFNKPIENNNVKLKNIEKPKIKYAESSIDYDQESKKNKTIEFNFNEKKQEKETYKKEKGINIFKLILVIFITFVAVIIVIETFKNQISIFFPDILVYLENLFQTLIDIKLFIIDLVK
tara:strand:+ start:139 stop:597 length:459 start_codon:yes stop_codon:yes gene_type:complete